MTIGLVLAPQLVDQLQVSVLFFRSIEMGNLVARQFKRSCHN